MIAQNREHLIELIDKAIEEAVYAEVFAKVCYRLNEVLLFDSGEKVPFMKFIINKCQTEFTKGCRTFQANQDYLMKSKVDDDSDVEKIKALKEEKRLLGCLMFIGELYCMRSLATKIILFCLRKLKDEIESSNHAFIEAVNVFLKKKSRIKTGNNLV